MVLFSCMPDDPQETYITLRKKKPHCFKNMYQSNQRMEIDILFSKYLLTTYYVSTSPISPRLQKAMHDTTFRANLQ